MVSESVSPVWPCSPLQKERRLRLRKKTTPQEWSALSVAVRSVVEVDETVTVPELPAPDAPSALDMEDTALSVEQPLSDPPACVAITLDGALQGTVLVANEISVASAVLINETNNGFTLDDVGITKEVELACNPLLPGHAAESPCSLDALVAPCAAEIEEPALVLDQTALDALGCKPARLAGDMPETVVRNDTISVFAGSELQPPTLDAVGLADGDELPRAPPASNVSVLFDGKIPDELQFPDELPKSMAVEVSPSPQVPAVDALLPEERAQGETAPGDAHKAQNCDLARNREVPNVVVSTGAMFAAPELEDRGGVVFSLLAMTGDLGEPLSFVLKSDGQKVVSIGRCPKKNHVVINHPGISTRHAELKLLPGATPCGYVLGICDISMNGIGLSVPDCDGTVRLEKGVDTPIVQDSTVVLPMRVKNSSEESKIRLAVCIEETCTSAPLFSIPLISSECRTAYKQGGVPSNLVQKDVDTWQCDSSMTSVDVYAAARSKSTPVVPPISLVPLGATPKAPPPAAVPCSKAGGHTQHLAHTAIPQVTPTGYAQEPRRCCADGGSYTYREFEQHYGAQKAQYMWERAPVASARWEEQSMDPAKRLKCIDRDLQGRLASAGGC